MAAIQLLDNGVETLNKVGTLSPTAKRMVVAQ